ncbi:MAG: D-glycero-alpha-D-manno-heptose-1,7-bisphosphate 7-phosphatase [Gemmatimonadota bacterium]
MPDRAVFVDRDGTIIREREYLSDPAGVALLPGAADGLRAFQEAGYAVVVVTNQSGIARGYYGEAEYRAVARELERRLAAEGVRVVADYHCPHHPDFTGPCDCRKPGLALFRRAAEEHDLSLAGSVYIGDRLRDVEPALALGGVPVLVRTGYGAGEAGAAPAGVRVADDVAAAARAVLGPGGVDTPSHAE